MKNTVVLVFFLALFSSCIFVQAEEPVAAGWSIPTNLGNGSSPKFCNDNENGLILTFNKDEQLFQSRFQNDGTWSSPVQIASTTSENTFVASDKNETQYVLQEKDGEITISHKVKSGPDSKPETIVKGQKKVHTGILHFSIDQTGTKHLLFSRTKNFEYGYQYPGSDVFYIRNKNGIWENEVMIAEKMSISRTWEIPGISVTPMGKVYVCSYHDLISFSGEGIINKEVCPVHDLYMAERIAADDNGNIHIVYQSYADDGKCDRGSLYYVSRQTDGWSKPARVGSQYSERIPDLTLTADKKIIVSWEGPDGDILISLKDTK